MVKIIDEDELAEHSQLFEYPRWLVDDAVRTATEIRDRIASGSPPFDGTAEHWLALLPIEA